MDVAKLQIPVRLPFDWQENLAFFRRHRIPGVEKVDAESYQRTFAVGGHQGILRVTYQSSQICVDVPAAQKVILPAIGERIRAQFDLERDPAAIRFLGSDAVIRRWQANPGLRIPGAFEPFETATNIILGQAVSIKQANLFTQRLVERFGVQIGVGEVLYQFPSPRSLLDVDLESIGITKMRAQAIGGLSRAIVDGSISMTPSSDLEVVEQQLLALKGVGPWTSSLILMRCFNHANCLPRNDLLIKKLAGHPGVNFKLWQPWASYLTVTAWNHYQSILDELAPPGSRDSSVGRSTR